MENVLHSLESEGGHQCIIMKCVYLLQSVSNPEKRYVGITNDLRKRLYEHNSGKSHYTAKYCPWKIIVAIQFENDTTAQKFETYLKSGSGHAFANRHLWPK
jgi:predicted GIY-YIG superfamily endonuclease